MPAQAPDDLLKLFKKFTGRIPENVFQLVGGGSVRKYYRMVAANHSLIGTFNPNTAENLAFTHLATVFKKLNLPVPTVLAMNAGHSCYLQDDLGDETLYKWVVSQGGMRFEPGPMSGDLSQSSVVAPNAADQKVPTNHGLMGYFERALEHLLVFQLEAHKHIDYRKLNFAGKRFDYTAVLDDLQYFRYYFIRLHPELGVNERLLLRDMQHLAKWCAAAPADAFVYRDFQSRNIIIYQGKNYYIDFQGGKQGPLPYDLVSLLWQAMAGFSQEQRYLLIQNYKHNLAAMKHGAADGFDEVFPFFVHLRQMQVLGAYGLRGIVQKKIHFLKSIAPALRSVAQNLKHYPLPEKLTELNRALHALELLYDKYPESDAMQNQQLTVEVFSFSYLQGGLPPDTSGHGGGFVFDCRALPNPGREALYRPLTGRDAAVVDFLKSIPEVENFIHIALQLATQAINEYLRRSYNRLSIGFGCTGGRHRSVYCAEALIKNLRAQFPEVNFRIKHHNLEE